MLSKRLSLRLIFRFLFSPQILCGKDILAIISASKVFLWCPDFLCISMASDLNRSDATPENLSVLFWEFVTPCFLLMIQNIPSPSKWQSHQLSIFSTQSWLNFLGLILCNSCSVIFEHLLKQVLVVVNFTLSEKLFYQRFILCL